MCIIFGTLKTMEKKISVSFYKTSAGSEPVNGSDMVLLHAIVKKSQKTPAQDLDLAKRRRDEILSH